MIENIIFYGYIFIIFSLLFLTYLNAKKNPEITLENLAFCIIFFTFQFSLLTTTIQFYLLWKLYFQYVLKIEKEKEKENGNNNTDK